LINRDVARGLQIAQPERDEVRTGGGGDLVDRGFAGEPGLRRPAYERAFNVDQAATGT
jgi:hypothetical protein